MIRRVVAIAIAAALLLPSSALADTCCANTAVRLDPRVATVGESVRLIGIQCLRADNSGPLPLELDAFWLWSGKRAAERYPDTAPGPGLPQDLPPTQAWHRFATVPDPAGIAGDATITVPDLPRGSYQLWWRCGNEPTPESGIHYSTGPRLTIGAAPETDVAVTRARGSSSEPGAPIPLLLLAIGVAAFLLSLRFPVHPARRPHIDGS